MHSILFHSTVAIMTKRVPHNNGFRLVCLASLFAIEYRKYSGYLLLLISNNKMYPEQILYIPLWTILPTQKQRIRIILITTWYLSLLKLYTLHVTTKIPLLLLYFSCYNLTSHETLLGELIL